MAVDLLPRHDRRSNKTNNSNPRICQQISGRWHQTAPGSREQGQDRRGGIKVDRRTNPSEHDKKILSSAQEDWAPSIHICSTMWSCPAVGVRNHTPYTVLFPLGLAPKLHAFS